MLGFFVVKKNLKTLENAPPGWEGTVLGMKKHPEITNPWALAWWMADQGGSPKESDPGLDLIKKWEDFEQDPAYQKYMDSHKEANAASSLAQLTRPQKPVDELSSHKLKPHHALKKESRKGSFHLGIRFREAGAVNEAAREVPVVIIKEGMGNKADRHFYSAELLKRVAPLFDGVKAYADHPSKTEETDRPERSVKDIVGYYHSPKVVMLEGKSAIEAILKINDGDAYNWAWSLVKEAAAFSKKFKDKDLVGISINAWGASHQVETEEGVLNMVDDLTEVQSADIVTKAGAGGGFRLREAVKKLLLKEDSQGGNHDMKDLLMKHGEGLKALHDKISADPAHKEAYGPAMEALMAHHSEMMKGCEAAPAEPAKPAAEEPKPAEESAKDENFEQMRTRYQEGKMTPTEKRVFEALANERAERKVEKHVAFVSATIRESGIPEAYADDLPVLCAGRSEADVKKLIESRKKLVAPLIGNRGQGAGAGGSNLPASKLTEKLASAGVAMKVGK